jgi:hypothetical protein
MIALPTESTTKRFAIAASQLIGKNCLPLSIEGNDETPAGSVESSGQQQIMLLEANNFAIKSIGELVENQIIQSEEMQTIRKEKLDTLQLSTIEPEIEEHEKRPFNSSAKQLREFKNMLERKRDYLQNTLPALIDSNKNDLESLKVLWKETINDPIVWTHRNVFIDWLTRRKHTATFIQATKMIRDAAMEALTDKIENLEDLDAKKSVLYQNRNLPIFALHRNNYFWQGAFGRTQSVINIDKKIAMIEKYQKLEKDLDIKKKPLKKR